MRPGGQGNMVQQQQALDAPLCRLYCDGMVKYQSVCLSIVSLSKNHIMSFYYGLIERFRMFSDVALIGVKIKKTTIWLKLAWLIDNEKLILCAIYVPWYWYEICLSPVSGGFSGHSRLTIPGWGQILDEVTLPSLRRCSPPDPGLLLAWSVALQSTGKEVYYSFNRWVYIQINKWNDFFFN